MGFTKCKQYLWSSKHLYISKHYSSESQSDISGLKQGNECITESYEV